MRWLQCGLELHPFIQTECEQTRSSPQEGKMLYASSEGQLQLRSLSFKVLISDTLTTTPYAQQSEGGSEGGWQVKKKETYKKPSVSATL